MRRVRLEKKPTLKKGRLVEVLANESSDEPSFKKPKDADTKAYAVERIVLLAPKLQKRVYARIYATAGVGAR